MILYLSFYHLWMECHANASINVENTSSSTVAHREDQIAEDLHEEEDSNC
jgi:hypothetical protein